MPLARNERRTLLASAARTTDTTTAEQDNTEHRGVVVFLDVTSITDTPTITATIQGYDAVSDTWYDILAGSGVSAVGTQRLVVYPGVAETANESASDVLPETWRVEVVHTDADSITYSLGASMAI